MPTKNVFALLFLLGTFGGLVVHSGKGMLVDPLNVIFGGKLSKSHIKSCEEFKFKKGGKKRRRGGSGRGVHVKHLPIAESGARGSTILGVEWCESNIGAKVPTIENTSKNINRINLYTQLWWPLVHLLTTLAVIILSIMGNSKIVTKTYSAYFGLTFLLFSYEYFIF
ncbi:MAG: hypothetical protein AAF431_08435 [Pseudomonadota bacterium]